MGHGGEWEVECTAPHDELGEEVVFDPEQFRCGEDEEPAQEIAEVEDADEQFRWEEPWEPALQRSSTQSSQEDSLESEDEKGTAAEEWRSAFTVNRIVLAVTAGAVLTLLIAAGILASQAVNKSRRQKGSSGESATVSDPSMNPGIDRGDPTQHFGSPSTLNPGSPPTFNPATATPTEMPSVSQSTEMPSLPVTPDPTSAPTSLSYDAIIVEPLGGDTFRLKMYWEEGYMWQDRPTERQYCMSCAVCDELNFSDQATDSPYNCRPDDCQEDAQVS